MDGATVTRRFVRTATTGMAVAAALVGLTGCADGTHPGSAAVIGDTEISLVTLDDTVEAVTAAQGEAISPVATLQLMISSELARQVASRRTVSVSESEVAAAVTQVVRDPQLLAKFEADPAASAFLHDFARAQIGLIKIGGASGIEDPAGREAVQRGAQIVADEAAKIGVAVSPRFGRWTGDQITPGSGSLSTPFRSPSPEPGQPGQSPQPPG